MPCIPVKTNEPEEIDRPARYTRENGDLIESFYKEGHEYGDIACEFNIRKYVMRHDQKGGLQALYKAQVYLRRMIEYHEALAAPKAVETPVSMQEDDLLCETIQDMLPLMRQLEDRSDRKEIETSRHIIRENAIQLKVSVEQILRKTL